MEGGPVGKNTAKIDVHPGSPREQEGDLFGFPNFSFQLSQVGYLYDRGHEGINIKSKVSTFHFANGDP